MGTLIIVNETSTKAVENVKCNGFYAIYRISSKNVTDYGRVNLRNYRPIWYFKVKFGDDIRVQVQTLLPTLTIDRFGYSCLF